jgi:hypothetical protein
MTGTPSRPVADLAARVPGDELVDADDVISAIHSLGVDEHTARERYGMSLTGLARTVLVHVRQRRPPHGSRRAPAPNGYLAAALLRCALYLGPLSVAVAAARLLGRVAWPVPVVTLLLGWSAAQALTSMGLTVAKRSGTIAAARLVAAGFLAAAMLWGALVWIAPHRLLGDRGPAAAVGVGGIATLATVAVALVTRTEATVIRWSLPCWLLGAVTLAGAVGDGWSGRVPTGLLLPAVVAVAVARAFRPAVGRGTPQRAPLTRADVRRGIGFLLIGAAQALSVAMLWRAGPSGSTSPGALPLLAAVPLLEALVGWHTRQVEAAMNGAESRADYGRQVRSVALVTVAGLLPPLAAGAALAVAAYRLPYGLSAMDATRDGVLALAAGTLLGGVLAATFLLAARGRTVLAASLAAAPPLAVAALPLLPVQLPDRLPLLVVVLTTADLIGLLTVAHTAADHRRTP